MELLVRTVDKVSSNPSFHIQLTKRGDVITYHPDGGSWGIEELAYPEWIILGVTDMTEDQANSLLQSEEPPADSPNTPVAQRKYAIDLDALGIAIPSRTAVYESDGRTAPDYILPVETVAANIITKPPSSDPSSIGPVSTSIGPK
jgi:hypothetical protein